MGAAVGEPIADLHCAAENLNTNREREIDGAADPNTPTPSQASPSVERSANDLKGVAGGMAGMPGAGLGGPPPTVPTSPESLLTDTITGGANKAMSAANGSDHAIDTTP